MKLIDRDIRDLMRQVSRTAILPRYQNLTSSEIDEKSADDFVTVADHEAEEMLSEGLAAIDGTLDIVGEEASHADNSVMDRLSGDCNCTGGSEITGVQWIIRIERDRRDVG